MIACLFFCWLFEKIDKLSFHVNGFLLIGKEGTYPAVTILLCVVTAVVLVGRNDLDSWLLGLVVANGLYGMIVHKFPFAYFVTD